MPENEEHYIDMQTERSDSSEFDYVTEHVTHDISLSSHMDAMLLVVCLSVAMYARLRKAIRPASLVAIGFAIILFKYAVSYLFVSFEWLPTLYPSLILLSMWLGPVGLSFLAVGLYKSYLQCSAPMKQTGESLEQSAVRSDRLTS